MKNITILMTIICAMAGPFALTQSVLRLKPDGVEKVKVDTVFLTLNTIAGEQLVEGIDLEVTNGNGQTKLVNTLDPATGLTYNFNQDEFELLNTNHGGYLKITPKMNLDPLNGVNTYDLMLINRHILGQELLNSPYKIIAADANKSGTVTAFDIVELRKLILGMYTDLPNVPSWRFIDKNQVFPNPLDPFANSLKEYIEPLTPSPPYRADFTAIKTGDVDNTATPNNFTTTEERFLSTYHFKVQDRQVKAGDVISVNFEGESPIGGYQFTLNTKGLSVLDVMPGERLTTDHFALFTQEKQSGWSPALTAAVENGARAFSVRFKVLADGLLSDMLLVNHQVTAAAAFGENGSAYRIGLIFQQEHSPVTTTQNAPNPWTDKTTIGFTLPEDSQTTLRVYDIAGRVVCSKSMFCKKGVQQINLSGEEIKGAGTFLYSIEAGTFRQTGRMEKY